MDMSFSIDSNRCSGRCSSVFVGDDSSSCSSLPASKDLLIVEYLWWPWWQWAREAQRVRNVVYSMNVLVLVGPKRQNAWTDAGRIRSAKTRKTNGANPSSGAATILGLVVPTRLLLLLLDAMIRKYWCGVVLVGPGQPWTDFNSRPSAIPDSAIPRFDTPLLGASRPDDSFQVDLEI
mmetsp:Transcript_6388/g.13392  ORF Transcript_6388/g.13392 Transcript_6388/m.13392 type:complete len:177 (+) Transcript_6388:2438-2968(+)